MGVRSLESADPLFWVKRRVPVLMQFSEVSVILSALLSRLFWIAPSSLSHRVDRWGRALWAIVLMLALTLGGLLVSSSPVLAGLTDDHFDGNIFALYAGNGSLVPPRVTLAEALKGGRPILLVFYTEDSKDCKQYAPVVSQVQQFYGKAADLIPINVDAIPFRPSYSPTDPGFYYKGLVPQTIVFNQKGKVVLDAQGQIPYEKVDDVFRQVFDLLPRSESLELRRRIVNEINTELVPQ